MAEKKNRYQKNGKNADNRGKKQAEKPVENRRDGNATKNMKNKPMTAAAAASHKAAKQAENAPKTAKKNNRPQQQKGGKKKVAPALPIRYTVLGGLNEIGKNMAVLEHGDDAIVIDCGMSFPDEDLLGVDVVLADFSYVL